jgi:hypothetical protein
MDPYLLGYLVGFVCGIVFVLAINWMVETFGGGEPPAYP